ncbi:hypothetical protein HYV64_03475 [Candidatus Shapirobacteria bacterium]|nr:hypothetical protein [Candidatus Shapirobacteria bacterium]
MASSSDLLPRAALIKALAVASGGENMSLLTKVLLQDAMKENSQVTDDQMQGILRHKLGLPLKTKKVEPVVTDDEK